MDERSKEILMAAVIYDTFGDVQKKFNRFKLIKDESFFDYELLKAALDRKHQTIVNFLLKLNCRVRNPNKIDGEETPLYLAMKLGNVAIIRKILKSGASIKDKNLKGETPLYAAFKEKHMRSVDVVLNYYFNPKNFEELDTSLKSFSPVNKDDVIHFQIACIRNNIDAVNQYLTHGFDVNSPLRVDSAECFGLNPLLYAITKENTNMFTNLLKFNGDLSIKNGMGQTALHIIYYSKETYIIERVFNDGNNTKFINSEDSNGVSHFHMCCMMNNPNNVQVFIDKGVNVNSSISLSCSVNPGFTSLHFAVKHGCEKVVRLLLQNGADCNQVDKEGNTPLHLAFKKSEENIVKMLLDYKACPVAKNENGLTPLHKAFYNIKVKNSIIDMLASKVPKDVNFTSDKGLSYFHIACTRNDLFRVKDLLKSGVDINSCVISDQYSGYTALHFAVMYNQKHVVEILLKENAQVNIKTTEFEYTPLHIACNFNTKYFERNTRHDKLVSLNCASNCRNLLDIIKLLLLYGADVEAQDLSGKTPLLHICTYISSKKEITTLQKEIIDVLLSYNANIDARMPNQDSILHIIAKSNEYETNLENLIEFLISKGAGIDAVDDAGLTPLHFAVKYLKNKLVQIFLKCKANVNAKTNSSTTALEMAINNVYGISSSMKDILCTLLEYECDVNIKTANGRTLLQDAVALRNCFIVEKLLNYGADINLEDSLGNSSISSLLKWVHTRYDERTYSSVFQIIFIHVQKLQALGLYVSKKVQEHCTKLLPYYNNVQEKHTKFNLDNIFDGCIEELDKMKLTKIDNYTSLYNILQKDTHDLSKHVRNNSLINILQDQSMNTTFPFYGYLLKLQFKKGLLRSNLLEYAKLSLHYIINFELPDPCYDLVLKCLSNEDIVNLKASAPLVNRLKRTVKKNSSNMEPPKKLQKKIKM